MNLKTLLTYRFDNNVGPVDRAFRVVSGAALAGCAAWPGLTRWQAAAALVAGPAWLATGVVSRCGIYYLLGWSTCPRRSHPRPRT